MAKPTTSGLYDHDVEIIDSKIPMEVQSTNLAASHGLSLFKSRVSSGAGGGPENGFREYPYTRHESDGGMVAYNPYIEFAVREAGKPTYITPTSNTLGLTSIVQKKLQPNPPKELLYPTDHPEPIVDRIHKMSRTIQPVKRFDNSESREYPADLRDTMHDEMHIRKGIEERARMERHQVVEPLHRVGAGIRRHVRQHGGDRDMEIHHEQLRERMASHGEHLRKMHKVFAKNIHDQGEKILKDHGDVTLNVMIQSMQKDLAEIQQRVDAMKVGDVPLTHAVEMLKQTHTGSTVLSEVAHHAAAKVYAHGEEKEAAKATEGKKEGFGGVGASS